MARWPRCRNGAAGCCSAGLPAVLSVHGEGEMRREAGRRRASGELCQDCAVEHSSLHLVRRSRKLRLPRRQGVS